MMRTYVIFSPLVTDIFDYAYLKYNYNVIFFLFKIAFDRQED